MYHLLCSGHGNELGNFPSDQQHKNPVVTKAIVFMLRLITFDTSHSAKEQNTIDSIPGC